MPLSPLKHGAAVAFALTATLAMTTAHAAPFMIVGDDAKVGMDAQNKPVVNPTGNDAVLIVDLAKPEAPKIVASLALENSIVGPPTNLAISPNGSMALAADSMTVVQDNGANKMVPTDKLWVIDMKSNPPKLVQTLTLGKQPSGLSFSPKGDIALVCNRADGSLSILKIDGMNVTPAGSIQLTKGISTVEFTPDGKHALVVESPENQVAMLDIDGDKVTDSKITFPTYLFPYNVVITPNSQMAIVADNGHLGSSDGNNDAVTVIDLRGPHPHVIDHVGVGDAPEGLAMSPKGDLAIVVSVNGSNMPNAWYHHKSSAVTVLKIQGMKVTPIKTIEVGRLTEPAAFTPDGRYIYVGNYLDKDFSILKVTGTNVVDTGKKLKLPGQPGSARMGGNQ
ncbi:MAG TPA: YncE family protein [Acetobacteraceae bacterium]|jgi:DNA-binding beta-propeller fold protein YncE